MIIHNRKDMIKIRKKLRNTLTPAEAFLWRYIKNSQCENRKFRRQHSIGSYVVDFYCPEEQLCIELDGSPHDTNSGYEKDIEKTKYLNGLNIKVLRFENKIVFSNLEGVLTEIKRNFKT